MLRSQIIAIVIAIVTVVILFNLPKVIINKTNKDKLADQSKDQSASSDFSAPAPKPVSKEELILIQKLRNNFSTVSNKEKKSIFADSLARTFVVLQRFDSAQRYAEEIVLIDQSKTNYKKAADIYFSIFSVVQDPALAGGYAAKARNYYENVLKSDSNNLAVRNNLAMTYSVSETPMQAIMILRGILSKDPENKDAIFNLGLLSIRSGQLDKAIERFSSLIKLDKANWKAYLYLGLVYKEQNKNEEANKAFERVIKNASDPALVAEAKQNIIKSSTN